jgi:hypothetical protein
MPRVIFNGKPGETWKNDTGKARYQFVASLLNTCGVCFQYHMAVSTWFPIPLHHGCRCRQELIAPGMTADPFVDFREILDAMPPDQKVAAVGASAYRLIREGVIPWEEVVTQSRVRTLEEVVSRRKLTVDTMEKAGVRPDIARRAWEAVNTPEHLIVDAQRRRLVENLRGAGLTDDQIKKAFGERVAERISIAEGPTWTGGVIGGRPTPIRILAPQLIIGLGLNDRAKAALRPDADIKESLPEYGLSKADVEGADGSANELRRALEVASRILGRKVTAADLASIAGAPDDVKVSVLAGAAKDYVTISYSNDKVSALRQLYRGDGGKPEIYNFSLEIEDMGKGLGAQILGRQIENATRLGVERMLTMAVGEKSSAYVGYQVWPKFGYDGPLNDEHRQALPDRFRGAEKISDLYRTKEGRDAWAEHGSDIDVTFDLTPGSYSHRVWRAYREEKARDAKRQKPDG